MTDRADEPDGADEAGVGSAELSALVDRVPPGWTAVDLDGHAWGLSRTDRAGGATTTIYAEQLSGTGAVSANVWRTSRGVVLRPCEMPAEVVLTFLRGWTPATVLGADADADIDAGAPGACPDTDPYAG